MALSRSSLSDFDRRFIIGRSAGCCNKCRKPSFRENEFSEKARLCDDAHIFAYSEDGPRGKDSGAPADRNTLANIILLCKNCHSEVDQQPLKYTCAALTAMRDEHYAWVEQCLGNSQVQKPKFSYILYLNMPRVDMFAVLNSIPLPSANFESVSCFRDLGIGAGRLMASYTHILNAEDVYAHQIEEAYDLAALEMGQYCFFEVMNFRTVRIDGSIDLQVAWASDKSVAYRRFEDWKLVFLVDPIWITTSTAESTLRSGQVQLCGVFRVSKVEYSARKIYASPLFLAQP
ncbi:HNH endonuclease [Xanthomonas sacchari]